ncbi:Zn-dependent hydrolase [Nonomuraea sp. NPDC050153]|uniref:Zn-dependent hydrolase n=1 Tax=Nonomuraea sp. NPDC050153 TaxID=3364359 RepID=UPI00379C4BCF
MTTRSGRAMRVAGDRLLANIRSLAKIGATADGGVSRLAFTAEDASGRELVRDLMIEAGLETRIDSAANIIGHRPGERQDLPALMLGSHIDTVPNGGTLDGAYGVLAAIEVARALNDHHTPMSHPLAIVAFNNEEGAFGTRGMWGAHALVGALDEADLAAVDDRGRPVADLLFEMGGDASHIDRAVWSADRVAAYLELHIEQGPVLESRNVEIGVVEAITGRSTLDISVRGKASHAGTTPMELRQDALVAAAQVILAVRELAHPNGPVRVATVGSLSLAPNAWNVVPGVVTMQADFRDVSDVAIWQAISRLRGEVLEIAMRTGTAIEVEGQHSVAAVSCDPGLQDVIAEASESLDLSHFSLPSGAGHDAQVIGCIAPIGMIFVPSKGGISHTPEEYSAEDDLIAGANVLLQSVLTYDERYGGTF